MNLNGGYQLSKFFSSITYNKNSSALRLFFLTYEWENIHIYTKKLFLCYTTNNFIQGKGENIKHKDSMNYIVKERKGIKIPLLL
jgi:hypothetical protein